MLRCLLALIPEPTYYEGEVLQPGYTEHHAVSFGPHWRFFNAGTDTIKNVSFSYYHADTTDFATCYFTIYRHWERWNDNSMVPNAEFFFLTPLSVGKPVGIYTDTLIVNYTYQGEPGQCRLPIRQVVGETTEVYIHRGESYTFHGTTYTEPGEYFDEDAIAVLKLHVIDPCDVAITAPTVLCQPEAVTLTTNREGDYYLWRGYGIEDSTSRTVVAQLDTVGTVPYTITLKAMTETGENLIYNGDFEQGAQGFSTDYQYMSPYLLTPRDGNHIHPGGYSLVAWPAQVNVPWFLCEHDGYMMVVDGSTSYADNPDKVFGSTVVVEPHTDYAFSAEIVAVSSMDSRTAPNLQFYINGEIFSDQYQPSLRQCEWTKIYQIWNSGDISGPIEISLLDHNRYSGGNDFAVDNLSFRPLCIAEDTIEIHVGDTTLTRATETITACDSLLWNGHVYKQSGVYRFDTTSVFGCDSVVMLNLTIHPSYHIEETAIACDSFEWKGTMYHESGVYRFDTISALGCDSVVMLNLTVHPSYQVEEVVAACDSFEWKGTMYHESGVYRFDTTSVYGCDSIVTLKLTVHPSYQVEEIVTACDSLLWHGHVYKQSGVYRFDTTSVFGCDSVVTLKLTVHPSYQVEEVVATCDSFAWKGTMYYQSGVYRFDTTTVYGCDSVVMLNLTVHPSYQVEEVVAACDSFEWKGTMYHSSGVYRFDTTTVYGCDSVITLSLTIHPSFYREITQEHCYSYRWHEQEYRQSGDYTYAVTSAYGCDSVEVLHLTIHDCSFEVELYPVTDVCAGEDLVINYNYTAAYMGPDRLLVTFDDDLHDMLISLEDQATLIPLPTDIRPDYYTGHLLFMSDYDSAAFDIKLLVRYPATVFYQKWNNVLSLQNEKYNGGYLFDGYRWEVDGAQMQGENHSYIYMGVDETLQMGHEYVAYLRRVGEDYYIPTCAFLPEPHTDKQSYPTLYSGVEIVTMMREGVDVYDLLGRRVRECTNGGLYIVLEPLK